MAHVGQFPALVAALDGLLLREAQSADVELVVERGRLEWSPFLRQQRVSRSGVPDDDRRGRAQDGEVVFGVALQVLLPERLSDLRVRGHEDPGSRAAGAGAPRPVAARDLAALFQLRRLPPEVTGGCARLLGVPIRRAPRAARPLGEA